MTQTENTMKIINRTLPGSFSVDNDGIINVKLTKSAPILSAFDKEFMILGTNSETLEEAYSKINADKEYQDCIVEEYSQDMLDYILAKTEETA